MNELSGYVDKHAIVELHALQIPKHKFLRESYRYIDQIEPSCWRFVNLSVDAEYTILKKINNIFNQAKSRRENQLDSEVKNIKQKREEGSSWVQTLSRLENIKHRYDLRQKRYVDILEMVGFEILGYEVLRPHREIIDEFVKVHTPLYKVIHFHNLMLDNEVGLLPHNESDFLDSWKKLGLDDNMYISDNWIVTERNFRNNFKDALKRLIKNFVFDLLPENHQQIFIITNNFGSYTNVVRYQNYLEKSLFNLFCSGITPEYFDLLKIKTPVEYDN